MPSSKSMASEIAAEAKKIYIPQIRQNFPNWDTVSYLIADSEQIRCPTVANPVRCRIAMIEGDPIDVALSWAATDKKEGDIPVISMANDKCPGGDWESIVFRNGPDYYQVWKDYKVLPIISVPPVRRPKLDSTGKYSFKAEKELMKEKIRIALRIAVYYGHPDICLGAYGCGPLFKNPTREVAMMFKDLLFIEQEFAGYFSNVVFAFDSSSPRSTGSSSSSSSHKSDMEIFKQIFDPSKLCAEVCKPTNGGSPKGMETQ